MFQYFKIQSDKTYFTADTHFGHKNIMKYCKRPFKNIEEHDEYLIKKWNETVSDNDTIFHLGDVSYKIDLDRTFEILRQLNGKKYLIIGNHDNELIQSKYLNTIFEGVFEYLILYAKDDKQKILLCHFPDFSFNHKQIVNLDGKFAFNGWKLHGHEHGNKLNCRTDAIDVGVDCNNFKPFSYNDIKNFYKNEIKIFSKI